MRLLGSLVTLLVAGLAFAQDRPRPVGLPPVADAPVPSKGATSKGATSKVSPRPTAGADPEVSTVLVMSAAGKGSGGVVHTAGGGSMVLTNRHVAPTNGPYYVRHAGKVYPAEWWGADASVDLAVLYVKAALPALELAAEEPAKGTLVRLFGYGGLPKSGRVIGRDGSTAGNDGPRWYMTAIPEPGDSGCPVVDAAGKVVALAFGFTVGGNRMGLAVPLAEIKRVIAKHLY